MVCCDGCTHGTTAAQNKCGACGLEEYLCFIRWTEAGGIVGRTGGRP